MRLPAAAICVFALAFCAPAAHAHDPNVLWKIIHDECVPDQRLNNDPAPCAAVDLSGGEARGHALLKDIDGPAQFLLIPTTRISGIDDPRIADANQPNYFAAAWAARFEVEAALHRSLPRDDIGLAINSAADRSQNQLHIHIDCLRPDVIKALHEHAATLTETWSPFPAPLAGHTYLARRLDGPTLTANPFRLLANETPAAGMADETLVVAGITFPNGNPGFILLADHVNHATGDLAHGEELQDHSCAAAG